MHICIKMTDCYQNQLTYVKLLFFSAYLLHKYAKRSIMYSRVKDISARKEYFL